jgi:phosphoribosylanthranilate isomerase
MPRVKICGVKRPEDLQAAIGAGADAIGLNFVARSPRYVGDANAAAKLVENAHAPTALLYCGVFVNASIHEIRSAVDAAQLAVIQLHGDESPQFVSEVKHEFPKLRVWKAVRIASSEDLAALDRYDCDGWVLDSKVEGVHGGSGKSFDWSLLKGLSRKIELILSGGLTPMNVAEAIRATAPEWVDVASGVESAPGIKDAKLIREFIRQAHSADAAR